MSEIQTSDGPPEIRRHMGDGVTIVSKQKIVSMCTVNGRIFVATEQRIYELVDGIWHPMVFAA